MQVASILVYIESSDAPAGSNPPRASLEALGEGRRLASTLGATLHAFAPLPSHPETGVDARNALIEALARGGADRVLLAPVPGGPEPAVWAFQGQALHAAYERVQPLLVVFPGTRAGRDLAPRLAARAGATLLAESTRLDLEDLERPVVVTLTPGVHAPERGAGEAEVVFLRAPAAPQEPTATHAIEYLGSTQDPGAALDTARVIVVAGAGVRTAEDYALVGELAAALGGELGATPNLCARGLAPDHRAIGVGVRHVAPDLYFVCAASGSEAHLGAVCGDACIIAIDADPDAPVFRVARYGITGLLEQVIPALLTALQGHAPAAVSP